MEKVQAWRCTKMDWPSAQWATLSANSHKAHPVRLDLGQTVVRIIFTHKIVSLLR